LAIFLYVPSKDELDEHRVDMTILKNIRYKSKSVMEKY